MRWTSQTEKLSIKERTCVSLKTYLRFTSNALAFYLKRTCVLIQTHLRFFSVSIPPATPRLTHRNTTA